MQKRRERIERWRAERKRKELESAKKEVQKGSIVTNMQLPTVKKWSLEDDSGDEGTKIVSNQSLPFYICNLHFSYMFSSSRFFGYKLISFIGKRLISLQLIIVLACTSSLVV